MCTPKGVAVFSVAWILPAVWTFTLASEGAVYSSAIDPPKYLVISPYEFLGAATDLARFREDGTECVPPMETIVVTTEWIDAQIEYQTDPNQLTALEIKNYIADVWASDGPLDYVVLFGMELGGGSWTSHLPTFVVDDGGIGVPPYFFWDDGFVTMDGLDDTMPRSSKTSPGAHPIVHVKAFSSWVERQMAETTFPELQSPTRLPDGARRLILSPADLPPWR